MKPHHHGSLHLCNWPGCRRPVPFDHWGCSTHWYTLPSEVREELARAWRFGRSRSSPEWIRAQSKALEWINGIEGRAADSRIVTPIQGQGGTPC